MTQHNTIHCPHCGLEISGQRLNLLSLDDIFEDGWNTTNPFSRKFLAIMESPGIYMFGVPRYFSEPPSPMFVIVYVGMSLNVSQRCSCHPVFRRLRRDGENISVFFKEVPSCDSKGRREGVHTEVQPGAKHNRQIPRTQMIIMPLDF